MTAVGPDIFLFFATLIPFLVISIVLRSFIKNWGTTTFLTGNITLIISLGFFATAPHHFESYEGVSLFFGSLGLVGLAYLAVIVGLIGIVIKYVAVSKRVQEQATLLSETLGFEERHS